jgi:hypothetical protein
MHLREEYRTKLNEAAEPEKAEKLKRSLANVEEDLKRIAPKIETRSGTPPLMK